MVLGQVSPQPNWVVANLSGPFGRGRDCWVVQLGVAHLLGRAHLLGKSVVQLGVVHLFGTAYLLGQAFVQLGFLAVQVGLCPPLAFQLWLQS